MKTYVIERADGYCYKIQSELSAETLLENLRSEYIKNDNIFYTFTPHINKIPVAIYVEQLRLSNNE